MRSPTIIPVCLAIVFASVSARATVHHVPGSYATIQLGIDAASSGDTVLVASDTYNENISISNKNICLLSETGEYDCVTIAGLGDTTVVTLAGMDSTASVVGFTITGGFNTSAGGVYCYNASPVIQNCLIANNGAIHDGGGIYCKLSSPRFIDCEVSDNALQEGHGGGIFCEEGSPRFEGCLITRNTLDDGGVGEECGGGAFFWKTDTLLVSGCTFLENTVYGSGGGIFFRDDSLTTVEACTLSSNYSYYEASHGGGVCQVGSVDFELTDCEISGNYTDGWGGGLASLEFSTFVVSGCVISGNFAEMGGGGVRIDQPADTTRFTSCTFASNRANGYGGGANLSGANSQHKFDHTILWVNLGFGGREVYGYNCEVWFRCCDVAVTGVQVVGPVNWGMGNFDQYPEYCGPEFPWFAPSADGDFTIAETSPCTAANSPPGCGLIGALDIGCVEPYINVSGIDDADHAVPYLTPGFPNPSDGTTTIRFALGRSGPVSLKVYDVAGRLVKTLVDEVEGAPYCEAVWDGTDSKGRKAANGMYFYRLESLGFSSTSKTLLLR